MSTLNGKVALVTGGAGGIGSGICEVLAEQGATVVIGYNSSRNEATSLADRLPNRHARHSAHAVPVTDSAALSALARNLDQQYGRLDILVNCHGATRFVPAENLDALDDELIDHVLATNVRGTFATIRALRNLLARNGTGLVVYGLNKVRFTNPVRADSRVQGRFVLSKVEEVTGGLQLTFVVTVAIEGQRKAGPVHVTAAPITRRLWLTLASTGN
jgi:NAD(P)-dependent dehydrogenase (short-subunit alcohol dehydrogenase family)